MIDSCAARSSSVLLGKNFVIIIYTYDPDFTGARVFDLDTGLEVRPKRMAIATNNNPDYSKSGKKDCRLLIEAVRKGNFHYRFHITDSLGRVSKDYKDLTLLVK